MRQISRLKALDPDRVWMAKKAYTTRRVPAEDMIGLAERGVTPRAGDLVLARVERIGHHTKLELCDGRRAQLYVGDEIIVCYGNRYATDQFEARVPADLSQCDLAAAGGIAGEVGLCHERVRRPTQIAPLGILTGRDGGYLNLADYALPAADTADGVPVLAVVGTAMNAGKTTVAAHLVKGLAHAGYAVGAAKVTGTGAGGDRWSLLDAGAATVLDFTDFGYVSTYLQSPRIVETIFTRALAHLTAADLDLAIIEIADGLVQKETAALLGSPRFQQRVQAVVLAASDPIGALAGGRWLTAQSLPLAAISGLVTRSPLAMREVESAAGVPVVETSRLSAPAVARSVFAVPAAPKRANGAAPFSAEPPTPAEPLASTARVAI